jgi:hypothetical protein
MDRWDILTGSGRDRPMMERYAPDNQDRLRPDPFAHPCLTARRRAIDPRHRAE